MSRFLSQSAKALKPSGIRRFFDIAATMDDCISLGVGEPDFVTPEHVIHAAQKSLANGNTGYTSNSGMIELRQAICDYIEGRYDIRYDAETEALVTVGVSEALWLAMKTILDPGDEVLVIEPCFTANPACVTMAGGVPVMVPTYVEHDFQVTAADLEARITSRTRAILINYPNNPTGAVMSRERMLEIADVVERHDLVVISDEIYERLVYDTEHVNFASLPGMFERTILLSGMSKSFAMTGWRLGYATAPAALIDAMKKFHQYLIMSAPTMAQVAALQALQHGDEDIERMRRSYDRRRRLIVDGFNAMGLHCFEPRGAFYCFPSIESTGMDAETFCERLLLEEKVAVIPGSAFGESGTGYIRACYATAEEDIQLALERIGRFVKRYRLVPA